MANSNDRLPEGTDSIIAGAAVTEREEDLIVAEPNARTRLTETVKTGTDKLSEQAADKARGFVGQGLERGSTTLANVSKLIGDTADGLDEKLGSQYGDYARSAATKLEQVAARLADKNPDELIDDTREFVQKSPGIALAGAAVVGFALVRLVKSGLDADRSGSRDDRKR
jgi:ElaB/YqjD/DUF883 family membrane-anchored ribosome-binding protein